MADNQSTVALNIGSQRVSMAVFEPAKNGGLLLKAYDAITILADPATEMSRIPQVRIAVSELAQKLKVAKSKVRYAISGQSVFTRFVKLPPLGEDNIEQIVTFEAQQHVPFPINEVVWDYQLFETGADKEVVLVAIKGDALEEINGAVNEAGLATAEVDVAPMALYNALRNAHPVLAEPTLLIDIGAKTSNLLYAEGSRFFTRSIAIGGVSLTTAIAKEYAVPFSEAEAHKTQHGLVALGGGHTEQLDETVAALAMTIRNALSRLPAEIARTTNYYRSQHAGSAPRQVLLAGGGANLPYVKEFFEEKLRLPVAFFNPLANVTVAKGLDMDRLQREAHLMGELVGLGLRGIGKSVIHIDLVPGSVEQERAGERRRPFLIAAAAALVLGAGLFGFFKHSAAGKAEALAEEMEATRDSLQQVAAPIKKLLQTQDKLTAIADGYINAERDHSFWIGMLEELKSGMGTDAVWVVDMEPLVNYNAAGDPKDPKNGVPAIREDYVGVTYGASSLAAVQPREQDRAQPPGRGNAAPAAPPKVPGINAVRLRGLWRPSNPEGQKVVYTLISRLREKPQYFRFSATDAQGKQQALKDEQIVGQITTTSEKGEFALPFEMVLPLSREIAFK